MSPAATATTGRLDGRLAVVTGAGRGIGRAIATRLAEAGADVCLASRSVDDLESTAELVRSLGRRALVRPTDLSVPGEAAALIEAAVEEFGHLHILVNNAGGAHRVLRVEDVEERDVELGTRLNYASVFEAMRAAAPYLFATAPSAAVLNVVSVAADRALPRLSYYGAAKAAVVALSRTAAREWGRKGVRVNCLSPGWIATDLSKAMREDESFATATLERIPLGRWGDVDEVADTAHFLVSDLSKYVTGTTVLVDGGFST